MARSDMLGAVAAAIVVAALAGCASGPSDIAGSTPAATTVAADESILTPTERARLEKDLDATAARQASEGRSAVGTLPSTMALAIIRQQQVEEARALLDAAEATKVEPAPPCDPAAGTCPAPAE